MFALVCAFAGTVALIFSAPAFEHRPLFVAAWLIAVHLAWLAGVAIWHRGRLLESGDARSGRPGTGATLMALGVVLAAFVFAPVYFSDDSIRHIHDGFYLMQGVDVYTTPPESLPPFLNRLPNHPDVGTIYLPFTQLQAFAGAALHPRYGFLAVYYTVCFALIALIYSQLRPGRERGVVQLFWFSPGFLIPLSARHADVQGLLLVCASLALLRPGENKWIRYAAAAGLLALAAGLKPEGLLWAGAVGLFVLSDRIVSPGGWRSLLAFAAGGAFVGIGLLLFAWLILFPTSEAWQSFMHTVALFTQWFAAYNPILHARETLYPDLERPVLLGIYRREVLLLALLWLLLPMHRILRRATATQGPAQFLIGRLLVAALAASILSKGVWHPWYFLWLLPALWLTGRQTAATILAGALPLFYLPVIFLRATGDWWMPIFYGGALIYIALCLTYLLFAYRFFTKDAKKMRPVF